MTTETLTVECDFTSKNEDDGTITMKMDTLHLTLPPLQDGWAYSVQKVGDLAQVTACKIGDDQ